MVVTLHQKLCTGVSMR